MSEQELADLIAVAVEDHADCDCGSVDFTAVARTILRLATVKPRKASDAAG